MYAQSVIQEDSRATVTVKWTFQEQVKPTTGENIFLKTFGVLKIALAEFAADESVSLLILFCWTETHLVMGDRIFAQDPIWKLLPKRPEKYVWQVKD